MLMINRRKILTGLSAFAFGLIVERAVAQGIAPVLPGTFDITKAAGVVVGRGQSSGGRIANGAAIQAALNYCGAHNLMAIHSGGVLEYTATGVDGSSNKVGLQVPATALGLIGNSPATSVFVQFATNYPALTIGDVSGSTETGGGYFVNFSVGFGTDQTSQTNGFGMQWGAQQQSYFNNVSVNPFAAGGSRVEAYIGLYLPPSVNIFACVIPSIAIGTGVAGMIYHACGTTGNVWGEIYLGGGGPTDLRVLTAPALNVQNATNFGTIDLLNIEWCQTSNGGTLVELGNCRGFNASQIRFEGDKLVGFSPLFFYLIEATVVIGAFNIYDCTMAAADMSGNPNIIYAPFGSTVTIKSGTWLWNQVGGGVGVNTCEWNLFVANEPTGRTVADIQDITVAGYTGTFDVDPTLTAAIIGGVVLGFGKYKYNIGQSTLDEAIVVVPSATITIYGALSNAQVQVNTPLTGGISVIWADVKAASGFGSSLPTNSPDTLTVARGAGSTGAFNILVRNGANTTTASTLATAGTTAHVARNGVTLTGY